MKYSFLLATLAVMAGSVQAQVMVPDAPQPYVINVTPEARPGMVPGSATPYVLGANPGSVQVQQPQALNHFRGVVMDAQITRSGEPDSLRLVVRRDSDGAYVTLTQPPLDHGRFSRGDVVSVINQGGYWHAVR